MRSAVLLRPLVLLALIAIAAWGQLFAQAPTIALAGATGAGLTIQLCATSMEFNGYQITWTTASGYAAAGNKFPESAGVAMFSSDYDTVYYPVPAGQCVLVSLPVIPDSARYIENSAPGDLECGTEYAISAFGYGLSGRFDTPVSNVLHARTLPCSSGGCTYTQGYWKTHGPDSGRKYDWPTTSLTLGSVAYSDWQLVSILNSPVKGNGLIALAHQLIAAKLNVANNAAAAAVSAPISQADAMVGSLVVPPAGTGRLSTAQTSGLVTSLTQYNEGAIGPGHCR